MVERDREELIRPAERAVAVVAIDHVVEIAAVGHPKTLIERLVHAIGARMRSSARRCLAAQRHEPSLEQAKRVVPERVDLDRLAAPRRHDPAVDLGVHPRELIAFGALPQQAVLRSTPMPNCVPLTWCSTISIIVGKQVQQRHLVAGAAEIRLDAHGRTRASRRRCGRVPRCSRRGTCSGMRPSLHVVRERPQDERRLSRCGPWSASAPRG